MECEKDNHSKRRTKFFYFLWYFYPKLSDFRASNEHLKLGVSFQVFDRFVMGEHRLNNKKSEI
jgi:hypothetical protein